MQIRYTIINKLILVDKVLAELVDNSFFLAYKVNYDGSSNRLCYVFFIYSQLVSIYKKNTYILIFNYTYNIYLSRLLLSYFDFVICLSIILPLAYILIPDEILNRYK